MVDSSHYISAQSSGSQVPQFHKCYGPTSIRREVPICGPRVFTVRGIRNRRQDGLEVLAWVKVGFSGPQKLCTGFGLTRLRLKALGSMSQQGADVHRLKSSAHLALVLVSAAHFNCSFRAEGRGRPPFCQNARNALHQYNQVLNGRNCVKWTTTTLRTGSRTGILIHAYSGVDNKIYT